MSTSDNFAKMFRAVRKNAGVTQAQLADLLDITQSTISKVEAQTIPIPSTLLWLTYATRFNFSPYIYQQTYIDSKQLRKVKAKVKFKPSNYFTGDKLITVRFLIPLFEYFKETKGELLLNATLGSWGIDPDYIALCDNMLNFNFFTMMMSELNLDVDKIQEIFKLTHGQNVYEFQSKKDVYNLLSDICKKNRHGHLDNFSKLSCKRKSDNSLHILHSTPYFEDGRGKYFEEYSMQYFKYIARDFTPTPSVDMIRHGEQTMELRWA